MFGIYRTFLALAVMVHHLLSVPIIGHYAVHGFFILSGYLMTLVMARSYGYNFKGFQSFVMNRLLRLYPPYFVIVGISVLIIWFYGEDVARSFRASIFMPDSISEWAQNLTLLYFNLFPSQVTPRLSPPTWALTVELFFYFVIAVGASRTRALATIWFSLSLFYMASTYYFDLSYKYRYSMLIAGSLPFSLGAMVYHYKDVLCRSMAWLPKNYMGLGIFALLVGNSIAAIAFKKSGFPAIFFEASYYLNYIVNMLLIIWLIDGVAPKWARLDKMIGDFSYPVYLLHWQIGLACSVVLWGEPVRGMSGRGGVTFVLTFLAVMLTSWIIIKAVDEPVEKLRVAVRNKAREKNAFSAGRKVKLAD